MSRDTVLFGIRYAFDYSRVLTMQRADPLSLGRGRGAVERRRLGALQEVSKQGVVVYNENGVIPY